MLFFFYTILLVLCFAYCLIILIYGVGWHLMKNFFAAPGTRKHETFISIVVAARNEADNIGALLTSISNQDYPAHLFEVIVVDDHSEDQTAAIAETWKSGNLRVKVLKLKDHLTVPTIAFKKKAIETGIKHSCGELIVTTDADCTMDPSWLSVIAAFYEIHRPHLIVMPVLMDGKGSFFKAFQMIDFMVLQGITAATTGLGIQGMCNGANLAYTKASFYEVNGFEGVDNNASGDDMMLLNKMKKRFKKGILYLKSRQVIVKTKPQETIGQFINQRIRWAGKNRLDANRNLLPVLLLVYFFNCALLISFFFFCYNSYALGRFPNNIKVVEMGYVEIFSSVLMLKIIVELCFLYPVAGFFDKRKHLLLFPFMQPFHIVYTILAGTLGAFNSYTWKNRKVK